MRRSKGRVAALAAGLVAFLAGGAAADDDFVFDPTVTEVCLGDEGTDRADCIGLAAGVCMEVNHGGGTTVGMGACLWEELQWWEARLEAHHAALVDLHAATDAEMAEIGATVPALGDSLAAMQAAWVAWRDAACDYEYAQWGGGTGGGPAATACMMRITAEQAMALGDRVDMWSGP